VRPLTTRGRESSFDPGPASYDSFDHAPEILLIGSAAGRGCLGDFRSPAMSEARTAHQPILTEPDGTVHRGAHHLVALIMKAVKGVKLGSESAAVSYCGREMRRLSTATRISSSTAEEPPNRTRNGRSKARFPHRHDQEWKRQIGFSRFPLRGK
jgi:hypothetical protein